MRHKLRGLTLGLFVFVPWLALSAQNPAVTVNVDVQAARHLISPLVYGVNLFQSPNMTSTLQALNCPVNRYGGNNSSTYNWNLNSANTDNDYFFESISDTVQTAGERGDTFITVTKAAGAEPMVTIPMLDWIAQAGKAHPYFCSYPKTAFPCCLAAPTFPDQDAFDPFDTNCGNGLTPVTRKLIDGADPTVAYVSNALATQQSWVQYILGKFNTAANGGVKYYILDNEHDLWWETHHDVVPHNPHYDQVRDRMFQYASMIKAQDPNALVVGPEASGWLGYILSPADREYGEVNGYAGGINNFPDRLLITAMCPTVCGPDYMPWLLSQFQQYENAHGGQRILDVLTVHYYPAGGDNNINTRSLWDPNYVDPSYINDKIMLIPRMKQWVSSNYPGTKIGITEYNWGYINQEELHDNIGYAVTQADVLGIFGREALDLATRWMSPPAGLPSYNAMKMYRNYDGNKSTFGDVSTSATVPDPDTVAAFAAQRTSDGKVTVMLLSKYAAGNTPVTVSLANFLPGGRAQVWQLSGAGTSIQHLADVAVNNSSLNLTLPPQSVTLLVIGAAAPPSPAVTFTPSAVNFGSQLVGSYSPSSAVALSNSGQATLNISSIAISGAGLEQSNSCPNALMAGSACAISIRPTLLGAVNGTLTVTDNASDSPQHVSVSGTGVDIVITLVRPVRPTRGTAGQSAAREIHIPLSVVTQGYSGPVEFSCSGVPVGVRCVVEPEVVQTNGQATSAMVKIMDGRSQRLDGAGSASSVSLARRLTRRKQVEQASGTTTVIVTAKAGTAVKRVSVSVDFP